MLVTCTDGRCGDGPGGVKPGEPGHDPAAVVAMRQAELEASCAVLKVSHLETLGYADSGMMGWPTNDAPGAFWTTPVAEAAARLAELIRQYQPDVVVTYDENGFYGHPDHIQAHRITMAARRADRTSRRRSTGPRCRATVMREFGRIMQRARRRVGRAGRGDGSRWPQIGLPDDEITTWVDTSSVRRRRSSTRWPRTPVRARTSSSCNMGQERFTELMGVETFVRVRDTDRRADPEDDLFAGLR